MKGGAMKRVLNPVACACVRACACARACTWRSAVVVVAAACVVASASASGCVGVVDADSPVSLGALDPDLIANAQTLIFSFSTTKTCKDIVDKSPTEIQSLLAPEGAPLQILTPQQDEHVFGKVPPDVPIAYFVLASSSQSTNQRVEFEQFQGSVFAVGCRDFSAPSGTRHDLPLTLFPTGLR